MFQCGFLPCDGVRQDFFLTCVRNRVRHALNALEEMKQESHCSSFLLFFFSSFLLFFFLFSFFFFLFSFFFFLFSFFFFLFFFFLFFFFSFFFFLFLFSSFFSEKCSLFNLSKGDNSLIGTRVCSSRCSLATAHTSMSNLNDVFLSHEFGPALFKKLKRSAYIRCSGIISCKKGVPLDVR
jgi:hypothetical protein